MINVREFEKRLKCRFFIFFKKCLTRYTPMGYTTIKGYNPMGYRKVGDENDKSN